MYNNMYASADERMLAQHFNENGFYYIKPEIDPRLTPAIVQVPFNGGVNLHNTSNGDVYQHMDWAPTSTTTNNQVWTNTVDVPMVTQTSIDTTSRNQFPWSKRSGINFDSVSSSGNTNTWSTSNRSTSPGLQWTQLGNTPSKQNAPYQTVLSRWSDANVRQGVRVFSASEVQQIEKPESPTKFTADSQFYDGLWMSLQGDVLPHGANPLDDYLHRYRDSRAKIYLDAALDNQGCCCEYNATDLDRYLTRNKDISSAIALRATLSEERRRQIQEPTDGKALKDLAQTFKGQAEQLLKAAQELLKQPESANLNPWDAGREDETVLIG